MSIPLGYLGCPPDMYSNITKRLERSFDGPLVGLLKKTVVSG